MSRVRVLRRGFNNRVLDVKERSLLNSFGRQILIQLCPPFLPDILSEIYEKSESIETAFQ